MFRNLTLGVVALISPGPAIAQSVQLLSFMEASRAKPAAPSRPDPLSTHRPSVENALRSFFATDTAWLKTPAPDRLLPSPCLSAPYAPAPWLSSKVEQRRRLHFSAITQAACDAGISPSLLEAVVAQESAYRTLAVSRKGAKGLTQLMPGTAHDIGVLRPFDPLANLRGGARYLRRQLDRFRRVDLALAAYNAGPERRALAEGRVPRIAETQFYVRSVLSNWARLVGHASVPSVKEGATAKRNGRTVLTAAY